MRAALIVSAVCLTVSVVRSYAHHI